jgi:hypothetical protein
MKKIKVGGRNYHIKYKTALNEQTFKEHDKAYAFVDYINSEIVLRSDVSEDFLKENLIHEILHALLDNSGIPEENLDKTIQILSPRIHAFITDNPEFLKFISEFEMKK